MVTRAEIEAVQGRKVQGADGRVMGVVSECRDDAFNCDRRGIFPTTWVVRYEDVASIEAERVLLARSSVDYLGPTLRSGGMFKTPPVGGKS